MVPYSGNVPISELSHVRHHLFGHCCRCHFHAADQTVQYAFHRQYPDLTQSAFGALSLAHYRWTPLRTWLGTYRSLSWAVVRKSWSWLHGDDSRHWGSGSWRIGPWIASEETAALIRIIRPARAGIHPPKVHRLSQTLFCGSTLFLRDCPNRLRAHLEPQGAFRHTLWQPIA